MGVNLRMKEKIANNGAIDLANCDRTPLEGYYILERFVEDKDYCDTNQNAWIWSIGRRKTDGVIFASTTSCFYNNSEFECLWLR